jgi:DNA-binding CsgD family transcriptional regulator
MCSGSRCRISKHKQLELRVHVLTGDMLEQNTILDLVGSVPIGVILVARDRQVISLNRRAREMVERADSLVIRNNLLAGILSSQTSKLEKLIVAAINGSGAEPNALALFRDGSDWPLWVLVVPLESHCAAVLISDPTQTCAPNNQVLSSLFGFTSAECRLASLLMQGLSVVEAARELGITAQTARSHLKVIFEKTGTNRQNHLMYLLLSSPAPIALAGMEAQVSKVLKSQPALHKNGNKRKQIARDDGILAQVY